MRGNAQLLGGGEPVSREELCRVPHDLHAFPPWL